MFAVAAIIWFTLSVGALVTGAAIKARNPELAKSVASAVRSRFK